ncbi:MAG: aminomethyl-transferring glycine dehydrogenase subunit GcvPB [Leptospiraceae bacterium]|nr:aminomethyl-transferring glycine dehydrogenase subunit GcvPB [Leptospiraceae bacterium]MCP5494025.1 aminomethyl-transferring glycine dehydrogenase subunit GcvPB [Leptospiraceae bacterium]
MDNRIKRITKGQYFREDLIFEKSVHGRNAYSLPNDLGTIPLKIESEFVREKNDLNLPEVSEVDVVRHFTRLSQWNYGIDVNMYPLGSCTMKYNPRINEEVANHPSFVDIHPELPLNYSQGSLAIIYHLQELLKSLTDMPGITLQPAAGAHGELTGVFMIRNYFLDKNESRPIILTTDSAHGTNPASCSMGGFQVQVIPSDKDGLLDMENFKKSLNKEVAALMITNPSTLGIFEENIVEIADMLHKNGSLLYMDGANYNAIVGKVSLGRMGIDISQLNLHKTFSTPHGGGGPGSGVIVASERIMDYLPSPIVVQDSQDLEEYALETPKRSIGRMKAGYGHFGMIIRALTYILTYGNKIHEVAENAVLNANIIRKELKEKFKLASEKDMYHEVVFSDLNQKPTGFSTLQLAKTLIDYGYHPPTTYFPLSVSGALMIEPTETESPEEIKNFCKVMLEIAERMEKGDESLKQSPQTTFVGKLDEVTAARNPRLNYFYKGK